ncbi:MAG TPA: glycosyltransferase family 4 protein [Vicinamibacterales bacterium]|nr:glycosyltransferase family 4 protein [Vicinamibacterales bacterium]
MKLACVVHRFGPDIAGGSEGHCRAVAERLAERHDVTILTSCARDHVTWRNEYPPGSSTLGRLQLIRFPSVRQRSAARFAAISSTVFAARAPKAEQEQWFRENGPEVPALVARLRERGAEFDLILFWAYRYYHAFFGLPPVARRAILVPTAEDDPTIRLDVLARFFELPAGFVFMTHEERELVASYIERPLAPSCTIGCGLDPAPANREPAARLEAIGVTTPFVLYLGRVDPNKGCETLIRHMQQFHAEAPSALRRVPLVLAGPAGMPLPDHPLIVRTGMVSDDMRELLLAHAAVLVVPSLFESLSMVLLEAWNHGVPALVNAHCAVLKGQVLRADGGLYYRDAAEFARGLTALLEQPGVAAQLGSQGRAHVDREYRWPRVMNTLEGFLSSLAS